MSTSSQRLGKKRQSMGGERIGGQSCSDPSRGRYLMLRLSSSASTSSGTRPFTRTAYIPRAYFAMTALSGHVLYAGKRRGLTCSLPPCHPALLRVDDRNDTLKMSSCARLNPVRIALHLYHLCMLVRHDIGPPLALEHTCMSSSQFGQPCLRKSAGVWIIEHSRQARSCFARGWVGIEACP